MRPPITRTAIRLWSARTEPTVPMPHRVRWADARDRTLFWRRDSKRPSRRFTDEHRHVVARVVSVIVFTGIAVAGGVGSRSASLVHAETTERPNIVLILTDDQRFDTLTTMPHVQRLMAHGITFNKAFVTNSLCCPSRVTINTGGYSHTTGVYTNVYTDASPYGGFEAFHRSGGESGTIAVALHDAGYRTALVGKYLNKYAGPYVPPGWDDWAAFSGTNNGGAYYNYDLFIHHPASDRFEHHGADRADYSTDVLRRKATSFLRSTPADQSLFLEVTPYAPHNVIVPAPRDATSYVGGVSRSELRPSFDEADVSDKPAYIQSRDLMSARGAEHHLELEDEALQAVDRTVAAISKELRSSGRLNNTLLLFMSDNGLAFGEHRWPYKLVPYEESIRVPFVIRYSPMTAPAAGSVSNGIVSNVDVAPTFAEVAGIGQTFDGVGTVDGTSLVPILDGTATSVRSDLLLEHIDYPTHFHVPSYCGLRTAGWMYARYDDGYQELYRLGNDPYELHNVASGGLPALSRLRRRTKELCDPLPPTYTWP
jgi:N-acetylglucosamine-6-sulfatase